MNVFAWIILGWLTLGVVFAPFNVGKVRTSGQVAESILAGLAVIIFLAIYLFGD